MPSWQVDKTKNCLAAELEDRPRHAGEVAALRSVRIGRACKSLRDWPEIASGERNEPAPDEATERAPPWGNGIECG